jgi:hypothetical protein
MLPPFRLASMSRLMRFAAARMSVTSRSPISVAGWASSANWRKAATAAASSTVLGFTRYYLLNTTAELVQLFHPRARALDEPPHIRRIELLIGNDYLLSSLVSDRPPLAHHLIVDVDRGGGNPCSRLP